MYELKLNWWRDDRPPEIMHPKKKADPAGSPFALWQPKADEAHKVLMGRLEQALCVHGQVASRGEMMYACNVPLRPVIAK